MGSSFDFETSSSEYLNKDVAESNYNAYPRAMGAWINLESTGSTQTAVGLMSRFSSRGMDIYVSSAANLSMRISNSGSVVITGSTSLSTGVWYYIVGISRGATDHEIFLNGTSDGTSSSSVGATPDANCRKFSIGARLHSSGPSISQYFDGKIAYAWVSGEKTIPDDILTESMYNPMVLVGYANILYPFDDTGVSAVGDFLPSINDDNTTGFDVGTLPTESFDGPPVHFPQMKG